MSYTAVWAAKAKQAYYEVTGRAVARLRRYSALPVPGSVDCGCDR